MANDTMDSIYARNPGSVATTNAPSAQAVPVTTQNATALNTGTTNASSVNATSKDASSINAASRDAAAQTATGQGYTAKTGTLSDASMADSQLNKITAQDSPLMEQARQQGMLSAARRGLQNSSIAAGASEAEAVKAATPLALQNSQLNATNELTDKSAINTASQFGANAANAASAENAQLGTNVNLSNASEANRIAAQNAQLGSAANLKNSEEANKIAAQNALMGTNVNLTNANAANQAAAQNAQVGTNVNLANANAANQAASQNAQLGTNVNEFNTSNQQNTSNLNAAAENEMRTNVLNQNAAINKQYLAGAQSLDLQTLGQQYGQLLSANQQASSLYQTFFNSIASAMQGNIAPDRLAAMIDTQQQMLQHGLDLIDSINQINFGNHATAGG